VKPATVGTHAAFAAINGLPGVIVDSPEGSVAFWLPIKLLKHRVTGRRFKPLNQPYRFAKSQNGYCRTFDLSIAIQPEPARPCGVPGILFKLR
jgi:hypothetical protein